MSYMDAMFVTLLSWLTQVDRIACLTASSHITMRYWAYAFVFFFFWQPVWAKTALLATYHAIRKTPRFERRAGNIVMNLVLAVLLTLYTYIVYMPLQTTAFEVVRPEPFWCFA